eukprot:ANDGO_07132.mRNA.1 Transcription initiation factor TFIID subunit 1
MDPVSQNGLSEMAGILDSKAFDMLRSMLSDGLDPELQGLDQELIFGYSTDAADVQVASSAGPKDSIPKLPGAIDYEDEQEAIEMDVEHARQLLESARGAESPSQQFDFDEQEGTSSTMKKVSVDFDEEATPVDSTGQHASVSVDGVVQSAAVATKAPAIKFYDVDSSQSANAQKDDEPDAEDDDNLVIRRKRQAPAGQAGTQSSLPAKPNPLLQFALKKSNDKLLLRTSKLLFQKSDLEDAQYYASRGSLQTVHAKSFLEPTTDDIVHFSKEILEEETTEPSDEKDAAGFDRMVIAPLSFVSPSFDLEVALSEESDFGRVHPALLPVSLLNWETQVWEMALGKKGNVTSWEKKLLPPSAKLNVAAVHGQWDTSVFETCDSVSFPLLFDLNDDSFGVSMEELTRVAERAKQVFSDDVMRSKFGTLTFENKIRATLVRDEEAVEDQIGEIVHTQLAWKLDPRYFARTVNRTIAMFHVRPFLLPGLLVKADPHIIVGKDAGSGPLAAKETAKMRRRNASTFKDEDVSSRSGRVVLMEYREELPAYMSVPSMGARVRNFYLRMDAPTAPEGSVRKQISAKPNPQDVQDPATVLSEQELSRYSRLKETLEDGSLEIVSSLKDVPFLTILEPGDSVCALDTHMFASEMSGHAVPETDFLLTVSRDSKLKKNNVYLREIDKLYAVSYQQAKRQEESAGMLVSKFAGEVPGPSAKVRTQWDRKRVLFHEYRLLEKEARRDDEGRISRVAPFQSLLDLVPDVDAQTIRRICNEECDVRSSKFQWKSEREFPSEARIVETLSPEDYCRYVMMEAGLAYLEDQRGIDREAAETALLNVLFAANNAENKSLDSGFRLTAEDEKTISAVQHELKIAPWISSTTFINAFSGSGSVRFADIHFVTPEEVLQAQEDFSKVTEIRAEFAKNQLKKMGIDADAMSSMERVETLRKHIAKGLHLNVKTASYTVAMHHTLRIVFGKASRALRPTETFSDEQEFHYETAVSAGETAEEVKRDEDRLKALEEFEMEDVDMNADQDSDDASDARSVTSRATSKAGDFARERGRRSSKILRRFEKMKDPVTGEEKEVVSIISDPSEVDAILKRQEAVQVFRKLLQGMEDGGSSMVRSSMVLDQIRDLRKKEQEIRRDQIQTAMDSKKRCCKACKQKGHISSNRICKLHPEHLAYFRDLPDGTSVRVADEQAPSGGLQGRGRGRGRGRKRGAVVATDPAAGVGLPRPVKHRRGGFRQPAASLLPMDSGVSSGQFDSLVDEDFEYQRRSSNRSNRTVGSRRAAVFRRIVDEIMEAAISDDHLYLRTFLRNPVKELEVFAPQLAKQYRKSIRHPMFLESVQSKVQNLKYDSVDAFSDDVSLMFSNARMFYTNLPEFTSVLVDADAAERFINGRMQEHSEELRSLEETGGRDGGPITGASPAKRARFQDGHTDTPGFGDDEFVVPTSDALPLYGSSQG